MISRHSAAGGHGAAPEHGELARLLLGLHVQAASAGRELNEKCTYMLAGQRWTLKLYHK